MASLTLLGAAPVETVRVAVPRISQDAAIRRLADSCLADRFVIEQQSYGTLVCRRADKRASSIFAQLTVGSLYSPPRIYRRYFVEAQAGGVLIEATEAGSIRTLFAAEMGVTP